MNLTIDKKAAIFRSLSNGTLFSVGIDFGLDKHYKDATAVKNKVYHIYREVLNSPEEFFVHPDTIELVEKAVTSRKMEPKKTLAEKNSENKLKGLDIKQLTLSGRNTAGRLINRKLEYIDAHPKALAGESLVTLGKIFGILFDKSQIIQGQATEHIALMGKIDTNMTAEEALDSVMRMREIVEVDKHG